MKSMILVSGLFLIIFFFCSNNLLSQWEPDVRLTNDEFGSFTNYHYSYCVAASGDTVHIVWTDNSSGIANETQYRRSTDGGSTWGQDTMLTSGGNNSWSASVTVLGQYVYVVWVDQRDGNDEIYFKPSSDGGTTWGFDDRISNTSLTSIRSSVAATGSDVHVVFRDHGLMQAGEIRYRRSTDYGDFWVTNTQLTNDPGVSDYPKIAASGQVVHVVWTDGRDGNYEIYYKRSSDRGVTWGLDTRLTLDANNSSLPIIAVSGSNVHLVWYDNRTGFSEIFYKRSTDGGLSWSSDTQLTINDSLTSQAASVAVSGSVVHIVWMDVRDGNLELYHKRSTDNGTSWSEDERLTYANSPTGLQNHSVTVSGEAVHVVWTDYRDGSDGEIYYKRNPTGEPTDVVNQNDNLPDEYFLFQNYPNPFNPTTNFEFRIAGSGFVTLKVYDVLGNVVETLVSQHLTTGTYKIQWKAQNVSSGVYIYQLQAGSFTQSKKLILLR